jgi:hypothetical protein
MIIIIIAAAQDQALQTKYHVTEILQTGTDSKCRLCKQSVNSESGTHYISMPIIAKGTVYKVM